MADESGRADQSGRADEVAVDEDLEAPETTDESRHSGEKTSQTRADDAESSGPSR